MSDDRVLTALSTVFETVEETNLGTEGKVRVAKSLLDLKDAILDEREQRETSS